MIAKRDGNTVDQRQIGKSQRMLCQINGYNANQNSVGLTATIDDQFTHNLDCDFTGSREDGDGQKSITSDITHNTNGNCKATLGSIQHGRHTITIVPKDSCGKGGTQNKLVLGHRSAKHL